MLSDSSQPERKLAGKPNFSFEALVTTMVEEIMPKLGKSTIQPLAGETRR